MDVLALTVAIVALAISIGSASYVRRAGKSSAARTTAVTRPPAAVEVVRRDHGPAEGQARQDHAQKATLGAELVWVKPKDAMIVVRNLGPGAASDVSIAFLDADGPGVPPNTRYWDQLADKIEAGASSAVIAGLSLASAKRFRVTLQWVDGSGAHSEVMHLQFQ